MKAHINIPLDFALLANTEKLLTPFTAYVALQLESDGIIQYKDALAVLSKLPKFSSHKSQEKWMAELITLGWIGMNKDTGWVFIRSMKRICAENNLTGKLHFQCSRKDLHDMKALVTAAILTHTVNRQKTVIKLKRGKKSEVKKRDASLPNSYPGISKNGIAKILNCSPSQAVKLKTSAIKAGYLKAVKHEQVLLQIDKPDYHLRGQLNHLFPKWKDGIFFRRNLITGMIELFRQLCDELVPYVILKRYGKTYQGIRAHPLSHMPGGLSMAV